MERDLVEHFARFCCEEINVDANLIEERYLKMPARQLSPGAIGPFSVEGPSPSGR